MPKEKNQPKKDYFYEAKVTFRVRVPISKWDGSELVRYIKQELRDLTIKEIAVTKLEQLGKSAEPKSDLERWSDLILRKEGGEIR